MKFFLLDKQQNIIGRLSEEYILEATFTEEINTAGELLITLPAKKRLSGNVIHVLITNPSKDHSYLMFKIIKETVKDEEVEYTAVESAYDELTSYGYIQDKRPTANAQTITEMILKDTRWHVGEIPDTSEAFISFYYLSILDCLKKIVQTFDFEIGFDVLINDAENQITDRRVNFYIKQGEQTGKRFEYGSNLLSVKQEQDTQNIYTALVGRGKGVQVSGGDDDNTPDGYGRRITFADVEWSKANGDPLDKPKGQEWLEDPDATKQLGFSDGRMRIGLEVFEDVDDPKTLLQKTYEALKTAERPQVQFSASVINTGELHLGDRVGITRNDIGIAYETRVFKVQHNLLDETQNKIDLGDNLEQTNNLSYQVSALQSEVTNNTEDIITVTQSANGKNKVYYSSTMPATGSNGDVWYKDLGNGETEMYIYDNGWQLVISTENLHKIEDEVKQQQTALDKAVQDANAASAKADGLVAQVGDANTNAQKALTTAQQNQADLTQAKNQLSNIQSDLTSEKSTLSSAISDISQTKQRLSDLTTQAQTQGQTIANIQKTQSGLTADIADVKGNVSSLQDTAEEMQGSIADNKNNIANIKATAQGLQVSVEDNKKNISTIQQQAGTIESAISTVNSDNLIYNSDFLTTQPGVSPLTDWKPADGWDSIKTDVQRCMWLGYSALQVGWMKANTGMYTRAIKVNQPNVYDVSAKTKYNLSFLIKTSSGVYDVYIDCSYDDTFNNPTTIKVDTITQAYSPWTKLNWTVELPSIYPWIRLRIISEQDKGLFYLAQPMLVYGSDTPSKYISSNQPGQKMSSIKQTIDSIQSTVQGNSGQISQVKQTADSLQSSITQGIGSYLPNGDFADSNISKYWVPWDTTKDLSEVFVVESQGTKDMPATCLKIQTKSSENKTDIGTKDFIPFNINEPIEIKAWSWLNASNGNTQFQFYIHCYDENHNEVDSGSGYFKYDNLNEWEMTDVTFGKDQWNKNTVSMRLEVVLFGGGIDTAGYITGLKIINGSSGIASEFTQTIDSLTSKIADADGNISQLKQTSDSLTSQIGNANNDISSLKQRADSMESNISDNKNDISDLKQTANSLQSNIQSKADISQITQLSNAIQSVVQSVGSFFPNGNFADSNVQVYWSPWDVTKDYTNINYDAATYNGSFGNLLLHASGGGWTKAISTEYIPVQPNKSVTVSLASRGDWYNSNGKPQMLQCYVHFYDSKKNETGRGHFDLNCSNNQQWYDNSATYDCNSNECYIRVEIVLQGNQENWAHITNVKVSSDGGESISSKISQMADDINMRVQKGDLLSQINIQAGSTLIQSKKLFLDASSVVFSGNAFIPSAAITDLSADKITAGTLNAGNVNIINLDVNKLVGNTTEFVRSGWTNAYGSHVQIDGGGMAVSYGDWYTRFDGNGMTFKDGNEVLGGFTRVGMVSAPSWYNGLGFNAGGDAEFLSIGAQDYGNDSQNPVPAKLLWMRQGINTYGYQPGWNFCDDVWMNKLAVNSFHYGNWDIKFGLISGSNGYSALTLTNGSGGGFFWGSDGGFGFAAGGHLYDMRGKPLINEVGSNGVAQSWTNINY